jgi:hypothetical protein
MAAKTPTPSLLDVERQFDRENPPNASILMQSMRHLGYNNFSAIADLVDNSIDAEASTVAVSVDRDKGDWIISILDDGHGMDELTLDEALKLGSDTERNAASDLGLYGMGLVTASISIGRQLEVITRTKNGPSLISVTDLDVIEEQNAFVKHLAGATESDVGRFEQSLAKHGLPLDSGTMVTISKSDGVTYHSTAPFVKNLRKHLAQTFRHYLSAQKTMFVDGELLQPLDPLCLDLPETQVFSDDVYDFTVKGHGEERVEKFRLKVVVLPDFEAEGNRDRGFDLKGQGFYVLRNNREIAEAQTLGLFVRHNEFNLFRAELSVPATMDEVLGVNFTKREVHPNQAFADKLREVTKGQLKTIRANARKKRIVQDEHTERHEEAARLITSKSHLLVKPKAQIERRQGQTGHGGDGSTDTPPETTRERKNFRQTQLTKTDLNCQFREVSLGEGGQIFEAYQEGRTIVIHWNVDHPFYQRFVVQNESDNGIVTAVDFFIWAWASAELTVWEDGKVAGALDQLKTLISLNTRTLLK